VFGVKYCLKGSNTRERRNEYCVSLGKPEEKKLLGIPGRRREDNLKRILKK